MDRKKARAEAEKAQTGYPGPPENPPQPGGRARAAREPGPEPPGAAAPGSQGSEIPEPGAPQGGAPSPVLQGPGAKDPKPGDQEPARQGPKKPELTPEQEARARADRCHRIIQQVLAQHQCRLAPIILPFEPIGNDGAKALIQATFAIVPQVATE